MRLGRYFTMDKKKFGKVTLMEKLIYGSGDVGLNIMFTIFSSYIMYFYTDVVMVNAAIIGTVILISRIFDGVSDLIAGRWIDTHSGKWGHCMTVIVKWSIPLAVSLLLLFTVPDASIGIRVAYIFVTYNLFNTVLATFVGIAHSALPTYVTDDPLHRSQMMVFKMLFAAIAQTAMASAIMPMVSFFGGEADRMAWVKSVAVFAVIGLFFLALNVIFVHERVEVPAKLNQESFWASLKIAVTNKYWIICLVFNLCINIVLYLNMSISIYYLRVVEGNMGLMGAFIAACNMPGIVIMLIVPAMLKKYSKQSMALGGTLLMVLGQIAFLFVPTGNVNGLLITAVIRGIGFSFPMALTRAMIADTVDYGEWKSGTRVQTMLFSANSLSIKIGQGLLTSLFGFIIAAMGYDGALAVQPDSAVSGINIFFRWGPFIFYAGLLIASILFDLEKKLPEIRKELAERRGTLEQ